MEKRTGWAVTPILLIACCAQGQEGFDSRDLLRHLSGTAPKLRVPHSDGSPDLAAVATFFAPPGSATDLGLSNGLSTDTLHLTGGRALFNIEINGKSVPIGPGLERNHHPDEYWASAATAWTLKSLSLGTAHKWMAAPGLEPWPPRGEAVTLNYAAPGHPGLRAEIRVEMLDGVGNDAYSCDIINDSPDPETGSPVERAARQNQLPQSC